MKLHHRIEKEEGEEVRRRESVEISRGDGKGGKVREGDFWVRWREERGISWRRKNVSK